jgi:uncharacterized membrane protein YeiH
LNVLLYTLDLIGVGVFAVSGALAAGRKRLDLIGVVVLALVTAIGGGTIRDVLLDRHPVVWLKDPMYLLVIVSSAFVTMAYVRWRPPPERALLVADALGLALFSVAGAQIAQRGGLPAASGVALGTITGAAGGIVRDVLTAEIPLVFRPGALYATAAIAGTSCYFILDWLGVQQQTAALVGIVVVAVVRLAAIWFRLSLPVFHVPNSQA